MQANNNSKTIDLEQKTIGQYKKNKNKNSTWLTIKVLD